MAATTADFYVQESDGSLIWIGSRGFDGYPYSPDLKHVVEATTRAEFEQALVAVADADEHFTRRDQGYPFGRKTSAESPFTYVYLQEGYVAVYKKGKPATEDFPKLKFPDLTDIRQSHVPLKAKKASAASYIVPETPDETEEDEE
jgi:hypothetical protein